MALLCQNLASPLIKKGTAIKTNSLAYNLHEFFKHLIAILHFGKIDLMAFEIFIKGKYLLGFANCKGEVVALMTSTIGSVAIEIRLGWQLLIIHDEGWGIWNMIEGVVLFYK